MVYAARVVAESRRVTRAGFVNAPMEGDRVERFHFDAYFARAKVPVAVIAEIAEGFIKEAHFLKDARSKKGARHEAKIYDVTDGFKARVAH
jgi:hypothetical protein